MESVWQKIKKRFSLHWLVKFEELEDDEEGRLYKHFFRYVKRP
jgi:hypothetical protein